MTIVQFDGNTYERLGAPKESYLAWSSDSNLEEGRIVLAECEGEGVFYNAVITAVFDSDNYRYAVKLLSIFHIQNEGQPIDVETLIEAIKKKARPFVGPEAAKAKLEELKNRPGARERVDKILNEMREDDQQ